MNGFGKPCALGLATAALTAVAKVQIRSLSLTEGAGAIALYFALTCTLAGAATVGFAWSPVDWAQLGTLIGAGFFGGFAHILMTLGIQFCPLTRQAGLIIWRQPSQSVLMPRYSPFSPARGP